MNIYYVYQYLRKTDSIHGLAGTPYYIGKGKYNRVGHKHNKNIYVPQDTTLIKISADNMNEADAFQLEMLLIHLYGRLDLGTGILRNKTFGGEGHSGYKQSEETKRKRIETKKKNGTLKHSQETIDKIVSSRLKNNSYLVTDEHTRKRVESRTRNNNWKVKPETITKTLETKKQNGTINPNTEESSKKRWDTRRKNGRAKLSPETISKRTASRLENRYKAASLQMAEIFSTSSGNLAN